MIDNTLVAFDRQRVADYTLLVQVGTYENTLAILDDERRLTYVATYDPLKPKEEINDILALSFGTVKVAIPDSPYTFVPADVFEEDNTDVYRRYLPDDGVTEFSVADILPLDAKLIYQNVQLGLEELSARFPSRKVFPVIQSLLVGIAGHRQNNVESLVIINKHESKITICCFTSGNFIYCNDFEVTDANDLTYYLLAVKNHLELGEKWTDVLLSGDIEKADAYYQTALHYGERVELADSALLTGITVPAALISHQHRFLTILALSLCE